MKVVSSNPTLKKHFEDFLKNDILSNMLCNILRKHLNLSLKPVENEVLMVKFQNSMLPTSDYDTGLLNYLEEVTNYLAKMNQNFSYFEKYVKAIKTDDVDNLQQLINMNNNVTSNPNSFKILMDCSAAYSSVKCVKYFMLNFQSQFGRQLEIEYNNVRASIIGGNLEIFHLLLEKYKGDRSSLIKDTIIFHQNKILKWIIENYVQFLSIYNTCCTRVLYDKNYIPQRYYHCKKCNYEDECCCHYCAKHCHVNHHNGKEHDVTYVTFCRLVYCDDECKLSQDMKPEGNKKFVEIDDLVLLSTYCANYDSLKILIKNGAYIPKCRDNPTRNQYSKMDQQLIKLFKEMRGFNDDKFMPKMTLNLKTQVKNDNECFVGEDGIGVNMDGSKDHNYVSFNDNRSIRQKVATGDDPFSMPQRHYPKAFEFAFGPQSDDDEEEEDQNQNQFNFQISNKGVSSHISSDQNKAQSQSFLFNKANIKDYEKMATEQNDQELMEKVANFNKYLNTVKSFVCKVLSKVN